MVEHYCNNREMTDTEEEATMLSVLNYGVSMDIFIDAGDGYFVISPVFNEHIRERLNTIEEDMKNIYGPYEYGQREIMEYAVIDILHIITGLKEGHFFDLLYIAVTHLLFNKTE